MRQLKEEVEKVCMLVIAFILAFVSLTILWFQLTSGFVTFKLADGKMIVLDVVACKAV